MVDGWSAVFALCSRSWICTAINLPQNRRVSNSGVHFSFSAGKQAFCGKAKINGELFYQLLFQWVSGTARAGNAEGRKGMVWNNTIPCMVWNNTIPSYEIIP